MRSHGVLADSGVSGVSGVSGANALTSGPTSNRGRTAIPNAVKFPAQAFLRKSGMVNDGRMKNHLKAVTCITPLDAR